MSPRNEYGLPGVAHSYPSGAESPRTKLDIEVLFTSERATQSALRTAAKLAASLGARIALIAVQVVPYPAPLDRPPIDVAFTQNRLRALAERASVDATLRIYLTRDRREGLAGILKPRSLIVLGARKRWWPTAETRLARKLQSLGHEVVIAETE
jgi:hypothetical protein